MPVLIGDANSLLIICAMQVPSKWRCLTVSCSIRKQHLHRWIVIRAVSTSLAASSPDPVSTGASVPSTMSTVMMAARTRDLALAYGGGQRGAHWQMGKDALAGSAAPEHKLEEHKVIKVGIVVLHNAVRQKAYHGLGGCKGSWHLQAERQMAGSHPKQRMAWDHLAPSRLVHGSVLACRMKLLDSRLPAGLLCTIKLPPPPLVLPKLKAPPLRAKAPALMPAVAVAESSSMTPTPTRHVAPAPPCEASTRAASACDRGAPAKAGVQVSTEQRDANPSQ
jgi:hypothetical protein